MALTIVESCVNCWACLDVCPSDAIVSAEPHFLIICPIEGAILNAFGDPINPEGSLTGIKPELKDDALKEIQAR
jgi:ferredoxin